MTPTITAKPCGELAQRYCGLRLDLEVLKSAAGYYLGTIDDGMPCSRESVEYWPTQAAAETALANGTWTQRQEP